MRLQGLPGGGKDGRGEWAGSMMRRVVSRLSGEGWATRRDGQNGIVEGEEAEWIQRYGLIQA